MGRGCAVIRCDSPHLFEEGTPLLECLQEGAVVDDFDTRGLREEVYILPPAWRREVGHGVGPEGGSHRATPVLGAQRRVMLQRVCRGVRRTQNLYAEGLEEGPRRVFGAGQLFLEMAVDPLRVLSRRSLGDAEDVDEL